MLSCRGNERTHRRPRRRALRPPAGRHPRPRFGRLPAPVLPPGVGRVGRRAQRHRRHRARPRREPRLSFVRQGLPQSRPAGARDLRRRPERRRVARGGSRRHHALLSHQRRPRQAAAAVSQGPGGPAPLPGGRAPGRGLPRGLPEPRVRPPVHPLGPELLQVPLPQARRRAVQRAAAGERLREADHVPAPGPGRHVPVPRLPVPQRHDQRRRAVVRGLPGRPQGRTALRCGLPAVRRQGRHSRAAARGAAGALPRRAVQAHAGGPRAVQGAVHRLRAGPPDAGPRRVRLPRLLRAQAALPGERAARGSQPRSAAGRRAAAGPARAGAGVPAHRRRFQSVGPSVRRSVAAVRAHPVVQLPRRLPRRHRRPRRRFRVRLPRPA